MRLGHKDQAEINTTLPMASSSWPVWLLAAAAITAVTFLPAPATAEDYLVGGTTGWNLSYSIGWPEGKTFKVGDNLVFDYPKGQYTVTEVDSETFRECYRQGNTINEWTSGHDVVALEKAGRRWFFSSLANHCDLGLKLVVNVVAGAAKPPAVAPAPAPHHLPPRTAPAPSPVTVPPVSSPAPGPGAPPPPSSPADTSAAALNHYRVGDSVARAAVVAGAVVVAAMLV